MPLEIRQPSTILGCGLGCLAQHDATVASSSGEMAALAIVGGPSHGFDGERSAALGEPARHSWIGAGAEVVRVGHERLGEPELEERLEQTGGVHHGVQVAMSRRAPLQ